MTRRGEFPATGKKVVREKATGGVRFTNCDPSAAYTIPAGSIVRPGAASAFAIDEEVFLPVAGISGSAAQRRVRVHDERGRGHGRQGRPGAAT